MAGNAAEFKQPATGCALVFHGFTWKTAFGTQEPVLDERGRAVGRVQGHLLSGEADSIETISDLSSGIAPGTILLGTGEDATVYVRGEAKPGFGDGGPRANLNLRYFIPQLVPAGSMTEFMSQITRQAQQAARGGDSK